MHSLSRSRAVYRPAFAINGLVILLLLILIGLVAWKVAVFINMMPANYPFRSSKISSFVVTHVVIVLFSAAVTGGVGALCYFASRRSEWVANFGMTVTMILPVGVIGFQMYNYLSRGATAPTSISATQSPTAPPPQASPRSMSPSPEPQPARSSPAKPNPVPGAVSPTLPRPATPPPPARPAANPAIRPVIDAFAKDLTTQIDGLVSKASKVIPDLARMPPHDLTKIKARLADAQDLNSAAQAMKKALDTADDDLMAKIEAAGVPDHEARHEAFRWVNMEFHAATRGFAADAITRLCDNAKEECDFLADNIGKWTLDSRGELKSSDIQFKQQAGSKRFFVKAEADRKDRTIDQLKGK